MPNTDYEGSFNQPTIPQRDLSRYDLVARYPDPVSAERALARLREQGLQGPDVTLVATAGDVVEPASGLTTRDRQIIRSSAFGSISGVVVGAIVGAIVGVLIYLIPAVHDPTGGSTASGFIVAAIIGAIVGLTLGGLALGIASLDRSKTGADAYGDLPSTGETLIGVRATGERARVLDEALRQNGALDVQRGTAFSGTAQRPPSMRRAG